MATAALHSAPPGWGSTTELLVFPQVRGSVFLEIGLGKLVELEHLALLGLPVFAHLHADFQPGDGKPQGGEEQEGDGVACGSDQAAGQPAGSR
jgi:hypothetical protein